MKGTLPQRSGALPLLLRSLLGPTPVPTSRALLREGFGDVMPPSRLFSLRRWEAVAAGSRSGRAAAEEEILQALADGRKAKVQKIYRAAFQSAIYPPCLVSGWVRWAQRHLDVDVRARSPLFVGYAPKFLAQFPAFLASQVVRSWCGAWFTSHRTQGENTLGCPLGCVDATDSQKHFLHCVPFWAPCSEVLGIVPADDVCDRGGYSLTPRFLFALAVLCKAYHGIRRETSWINNARSGRFELNKGLWALGVGASFRRFAGIDLSRVLPVDRLVA
jgi:hypothetical protein